MDNTVAKSGVQVTASNSCNLVLKFRFLCINICASKNTQPLTLYQMYPKLEAGKAGYKYM